MKSIIAAAFIAASLPALCHAATLEFPSDDPVASITIPDDWEPTETDAGVNANSADDAIYISIDVADEETSDDVVNDAVTFLQKSGVKVDTATQKESTEKLNGMDMTNLDWSGTDDDGDVSIGLSFLSPKPGKLLVITYWGTKGMQEQHGPELQAIITSLKPAE